MDQQEIKAILLKHGESLNNIDKTLVRQEFNLSEHMRRTALLETSVAILQRKQYNAEGAMKLLAVVGTLFGVAATIMRMKGIL